MRLTIIISAICLVLASIATRMMMPEQESGGTLIYWVTDPNPARISQVEAFEAWQITHGHTTPDGAPRVRVKVDAANSSLTKLLVQSVSGVAGDVLDIHRGGARMQLFADLGVLTDLTDIAPEHGFGVDATYDSASTEFVFDGKQLGYPFNVGDETLLVNRDAFTSRGLTPPPKRWTFDEFERAGVEFVQAANEDTNRQTHFFIDRVRSTAMMRSLGLSVFNETLTASDLDDPRYVEVIRHMQRWTDLGLVPSAEAVASMSGEAGFGGIELQQFHRGRFAMVWRGRYALILLRRLGSTAQLSASEPPHGGFPNTVVLTRTAAIYAGSDHPEEATLFLSFLASPEYNELLIREADAMPPNPLHLEGNDLFFNPPEFPNEQLVHGRIYAMMNETAIGGVYSPFVLFTDVRRAMLRSEDRVTAGIATPEEAAADAAAMINDAIQRSLRDRPHLQPDYNARVERQRLIESRIAAGQTIPRSWIDNTFYQRYYDRLGILTDDESSLTIDVTETSHSLSAGIR